MWTGCNDGMKCSEDEEKGFFSVFLGHCKRRLYYINVPIF